MSKQEDVEKLLCQENKPYSIKEIIQNTSVENMADAQRLLRHMINDGLISTTPEWKYKAGTRLRKKYT